MMANPLQTILEMYVGTNSTDPAHLSRIFERSVVSDFTSTRCRGIFASVAVYNLYWESYDRAMNLAESIDAVMADGEHRLILEEAQDLGYSLPDMQAFREEAELYKRTLENLEREAGKSSRQNYIEVPIETARQLNDMMKNNCYMITRIFDECFNTEYMEHFSFYRKKGVRYAGPNALQPCVDLLISMARTIQEIENPTKAGDPKPNWDALIAGNREDFLKPQI